MAIVLDTYTIHLDINASAVDKKLGIARHKIESLDKSIGKKKSGLIAAGGAPTTGIAESRARPALAAGGVSPGIGAGLGIAGLVLGSQVKQGIDELVRYDEQLIAIAKTTDLTRESLEKLGKSLFKSTQSGNLKGSTLESLLDYAEIGGAGGIKNIKQLQEFSENFAKLEIASDVNGQQAAKDVLQVLNLTKEGSEGLKSFASNLVALANDFPTFESNIISVAKELSKSAGVMGATANEVAGLSASMAILGVAPEVAATTFGKVMKVMEEDAKGFSKIMGMTEKDMLKLRKENPTEAFYKLVGAIKDTESEGKSLNFILEELGLSEIRVSKSLSALVSGYEIYGKVLQRSQKESKENIALDKEATAASQAMSAKLTAANEKMMQARRDLAQSGLAELFIDGKSAAASLLSVVSGVGGSMVKLVSSLALGRVAMFGLAKVTGGATLKALLKIGGTGGAIALIRTGLVGLGRFALGSNPLGWLITVGIMVYQYWDKIPALFDYVSEKMEKVRKVALSAMESVGEFLGMSEDDSGLRERHAQMATRGAGAVSPSGRPISSQQNQIEIHYNLQGTDYATVREASRQGIDDGLAGVGAH